MTPRNLLILACSAAVSLACYSKAQRNRYAAAFVEGMRLIEAYYIEPVPERRLFENAMHGMLERLDPYSAYFSPESYQRIEESLDQEFGGIGIVVELAPETQQLTVLSPLVGTPAYEAGMRAGDVILAIDGEPTEGMTLEDAVTRMRGPPGQSVRLTVRHAGEKESVELTIRRDVIPIESVLGDTRAPDGRWSYVLQDRPDIAYLRVTQFGKHTVEELREAIRAAGGPPRAVVLDLRNNAGGLLTSAVETCDLFLSGGLIVSIRGRGGRLLEQYEAGADTALPGAIPMAVLVNRYSASASEIVAACLQDHGRAAVVGERTFGKGTVQNIIELEGGRSALKLTTASYWRPSGANIHRGPDATEEDEWGVRPDPGLEVRLTDEQLQRFMEARRRRDIVHAADERPPDAARADASEDATPWLDVDIQLRRAVRHLDSQAPAVSRRSRLAPPGGFARPASEPLHPTGAA